MSISEANPCYKQDCNQGYCITYPGTKGFQCICNTGIHGVLCDRGYVMMLCNDVM